MRSPRTALLLPAAVAAFAPTIGAVLAPGGTTRAAAAQQASPALTHLAHVATRFDGAPGSRGLTVTAAVEVNAAMMHANRAAGQPNDLDAMKTHVRHVLHALAPAGGGTGPGLGYGVRRAADAVAAHIEMAAKAPEASETIRKLAPGVAIAARALAARAQAMADLGARIIATTTAADARPLVEALRTMALELDTGRDANLNGRIDLDATEPGINQLEAQVYSILEGEKLPRILE